MKLKLEVADGTAEAIEDISRKLGINKPALLTLALAWLEMTYDSVEPLSREFLQKRIDHHREKNPHCAKKTKQEKERSVCLACEKWVRAGDLYCWHCAAPLD